MKNPSRRGLEPFRPYFLMNSTAKVETFFEIPKFFEKNFLLRAKIEGGETRDEMLTKRFFQICAKADAGRCNVERGSEEHVALARGTRCVAQDFLPSWRENREKRSRDQLRGEKRKIREC